MVWFWIRVRFRVADCCIQTAGESEKMRINHVIKTDQWHAAPHFVVSLLRSMLVSHNLVCCHRLCYCCNGNVRFLWENLEL